MTTSPAPYTFRRAQPEDIPPGVVWRQYETTDGPALFELHLHQSPRFARTASDMDVMIRARTCGAQTFTASRNGCPAAYAVFKSIRETATISESNGDQACLHGITTCLPPGALLCRSRSAPTASTTSEHPALRRSLRRLTSKDTPHPLLPVSASQSQMFSVE